MTYYEDNAGAWDYQPSLGRPTHKCFVGTIQEFEEAVFNDQIDYMRPFVFLQNDPNRPHYDLDGS